MNEHEIQVTFRSGYQAEDKPMYCVYQEHYTDATDKEDGSMLAVVDKSTHSIVEYRLAFDGFWNKA